MRKEDFENALMSTIVEYISDQVILRYMDTCKRAAVLFTGALIGYKEAVESLNDLKSKGWQFTAVLSKAAAEVITEEKIKNDIDPVAIYVEGAPVNGRQIVNDNQFVIIPTLTINTAAKLSNCIFDNLITNMTSYALHSGTPVIAAVDGCCPDNKVRHNLGFKVTDAYKAKLRSNLVDLQTYGIQLTTDKSLAGKVEKIFAANFDFQIPEGTSAKFELPFEIPGLGDIASKVTMQIMSSSKEPEVPVLPEIAKEEVQTTSIRLNNSVLGRNEVARNSHYKTIIVKADTLVTALALDEADKRGISIVKE